MIWEAVDRKTNVHSFLACFNVQKGLALRGLPTTQQEPEKTIWEVEYSPRSETPTVTTIRRHLRSAVAHTALLQEEKQGTAVCWANGPNTGSLSVGDAWFTLMKRTGKCFYAYCYISAVPVNIQPGASEDIHSSKLLMCEPPAKSDTVQYNAWLVLVKHPGWWRAVWSPCLLSDLVSASPTFCFPAVATVRNKFVLRNGDTWGKEQRSKEKGGTAREADGAREELWWQHVSLW